MKKLLIIFLFILSLASCRSKRHKPDDDRASNEFYAEYVRIYQAYNIVPLDTTETALQAYLVKFPNNSQAWTFLGRVYLDMRQNDNAESAYRNALKYNVKYGPAMSGLGSVYSWNGRNDSALIWVTAAVANGDSSYYNYVNIAIINLRRMDTAAAAKEIPFLANTDSITDELLKYIVVISGELKDDSLQQKSLAALARHAVKDSLLDMYLAQNIKAMDFFDEKRKQLKNGK